MAGGLDRNSGRIGGAAPIHGHGAPGFYGGEGGEGVQGSEYLAVVSKRASGIGTSLYVQTKQVSQCELY